MIRRFPCYYKKTQVELRELFATSVFIFDTNVLLDIYRLDPEYSAKVISLIEHYKERIKIPYHVAEEYHENLIETLVGHQDKLRKAKSLLEFERFKQVVIDHLKDYLPIKTINDFTSKLKSQLNRFNKELTKQEMFLSDELKNCSTQRRLSDLLSDLILDKLPQEKITEIENEGAIRYDKKIPPGYRDDDKSSNKYGDLIIWHEILKYAHENDVSIIFISRDLKEDWYDKKYGKVQGPRIELLKEYNTVAPNRFFHIYTMENFLEFANQAMEHEKLFSEEEMESMKEMLYITEVNESYKVEVNDDDKISTKLKSTLPSRIYKQIPKEGIVYKNKCHTKNS